MQLYYIQYIGTYVYFYYLLDQNDQRNSTIDKKQFHDHFKQILTKPNWLLLQLSYLWKCLWKIEQYLALRSVSDHLVASTTKAYFPILKVYPINQTPTKL